MLLTRENEVEVITKETTTALYVKIILCYNY